MMPGEIQEARDSGGLFSIPSFNSIVSFALDLVFPPRCLHCGRVDTVFCDVCQAEMLQLPLTLIEVDISPMQGVVSSGLHRGILQSGVQALKYGGQRHVGRAFADRLYSVIQDKDWQFDTIIPVPLHTARLQKRGYNQAKEISIHLAELTNKAHDDDSLIRQSQTQSQVGLTKAERLENVNDAFTVSSDKIEGASVLLVDDVRTTGATMVACATALLAAGATAVYGITVSAAERS